MLKFIDFIGLDRDLRDQDLGHPCKKEKAQDLVQDRLEAESHREQDRDLARPTQYLGQDHAQPYQGHDLGRFYHGVHKSLDRGHVQFLDQCPDLGHVPYQDPVQDPNHVHYRNLAPDLDPDQIKVTGLEHLQLRDLEADLDP